jgi:uncharacterized protein involved in type VI secretion and phage assembly
VSVDPLHGAYPAVVRDVRDPDGQGRVKVSFPWASDRDDAGDLEVWARLATLGAGHGRGTWLVPDVGDEVLVVFERGDASRPYVIGSVWNGRDQPPESMDGAGRNDRKVIRSRNGTRIVLDDSDGHEQVVLETPAGATVTLRDGPATVEVVDGNGNSITLGPAGTAVVAATKLTLTAASLQIVAGSLKIDGAATFSGKVTCDTLVTNSVVASSYTPGAGNVM